MPDLLNFLLNHSLLTYVGATALILLILIEVMRASNNRFMLNPQQAVQLINHQHAIVFDLRSASEFANGHIINAQRFNVNKDAATPNKLAKFKNKPLLFVCATGSQCQKEAATFLKLGHPSFGLNGGMQAWVSAQLPIIKD